MKAQFTQEAKNEIIKALQEEIDPTTDVKYPSFDDGVKKAISIVESFPTSDDNASSGFKAKCVRVIRNRLDGLVAPPPPVNDTFRKGVQYALEIIEGLDEGYGGKPNPTDNGNQNASANWIPVSERLPEERFVIGNVITRNGDVVMEVNYRDNGRFYDHEDCLLKVSHWQPLPKSP